MHRRKLHVVAVRVEHILEVDRLTVRQVNERNKTLEPKAVPISGRYGIVLCLAHNVITKRVFLALCFNDGYGLVFDKQKVIALLVAEHEGFLDRLCIMGNVLVTRHNLPTSIVELLVYALAGLLLGRLYRHHLRPPRKLVDDAVANER